MQRQYDRRDPLNISENGMLYGQLRTGDRRTLSTSALY